VNVVLFNKQLKQQNSFDVTVSEKVTDIKEAVGKACPSVIYANGGDYGFVKLALDSQSVDYMKHHLQLTKDTFQRLLFWGSLWDMVRGNTLAAREFLSITLAHFPSETNEAILNFVSSKINGALFFLPNISAEQKAIKMSLTEKMETMLWDSLNKNPHFSIKKNLFIQLTMLDSPTPAMMEKYQNLLAGKETVPGMALDQDLRWRVLKRLAANRVQGVEAMIQAEAKKDQTADGENSLLACQVALADNEGKETYVQRLTAEQRDTSLNKNKIIASSLFPDEQEDLRNKFAPRFFKLLGDMLVKHKSDDLLIFSRLAPSCWDSDHETLYQDFMSSHKQLPPAVNKSLQKQRFDAQLCEMARGKN
jgi:aminopeptidase N